MPNNRNRIENALVVGAGLAGCSTAIALGQRGVQVTLVEKQSRWHFQSSGIFVYSNGLAALQAIGVLKEILAAGFAIPDGKNIYLDHEGQPIVDVFYPSIDGNVPPVVGIKRAEIHRILSAKLAETGSDIRLGTRVSHLEIGSAFAPAQVQLSDGSSASYDLVIGADGIRSSIRQQLFPAVTPRSTGLGVWRSVHERPANLDLKIMAMGIGKRLGVMPISDDKLYIFGTVPEPDQPHYPQDSWPATMRAKFAEFQQPLRSFLDEVSPATQVMYTMVEEIVHRPPWHRGRTLLIGDAAHACTPFMGQGGAMAFEDAVVLGKLLDANPTTAIPDVLERFGELRYPMCRFVQDVSREVGEAGAIEDATHIETRNANMRSSTQKRTDAFYERIAQLQRDVHANLH